MRAFLVFDESYSPVQLDAAADALSIILRLRGIDGTATWYFDDDTIDGDTEYGVRVDIHNLSPESSIDHFRSLWQLVVQQFDDPEIHLEVHA